MNRAKGSRFTRMTFCLMLIMCGSVLAEQVPSQERESIRSLLEQQWSSIDTLSFRSHETPADGHQPDRDIPAQTYDVTIGPGGRRAFRVTSEGRIIVDTRTDGKRKYTSQYHTDDPKSLSRVTVNNQKDTHDDYRGSMCSLLWVYTPLGKPLHLHVLDAESLDYAEDGAGEKIVVMRTKHRGWPLLCELDPAHDYLPRRMVWGSEDYPRKLEVAEFQRIDGKWFPLRGTQTINMKADSDFGRGQPLPEFPQHRRFEISNIQVNHPVDPKVFAAPERSEGVMFNDNIVHKAHVDGGPEAMKALAARYRLTPDSEDTPVVEAGRDPESPPWAVILGVSSIVALISAFIINQRLNSRGR